MSSTATSLVGKYLDEANFGKEHYKLLSLVGAGGFFDSFDIYLAGSVLGTMVATKFSTVSLNASFISSTFAGLLIGTLVAGRVGDRYGRRTSYLYALLLYGVATIITAAAATPYQVIALRGIGGLGLGAVIITSYGMWNEFLPRERRGWWASVLSLIINLAQPVSALAALLAIPYFGWRSMFIIAGVPAVVTWAFQIRYLRESPRWLEANGRLPEAFETVRHFNPEAPEYSVVAAQTAARPAKAKSARVELRDLFRGPMLKITILGILLSVCFQVPYYSFQAWVPTYLVKGGFPIVGTLAFAFVMQLGAIPGNLLAGYLGDRYGRKWTNVVLYMLLGVIGIVYAYSVNVFELMIVGFLFVMAANIAIALTIASYIPEMFPTSVRLQGSALANAVGRAGTILSPFMVAALFQAFGIAGVFYSSLLIFALGAIAIAIMGPETRKKSLEQIAAESMGAASPPQAAS